MHVARRAAEDAAPSKQMATWTFSDEVRPALPTPALSWDRLFPTDPVHAARHQGWWESQQSKPLAHSTATRAGWCLMPRVQHSMHTLL